MIDTGSLCSPGWRRWLLAGASGTAAAAALPPFYALSVLWISLVSLGFLTLTANGWRQAFFEGWLFGIGWFGAGLYWIGHAFLVDADRYAFLMPFAVIGIAACMAIYIAAFSICVNFLARRFSVRGLPFVLLFAGCWTLIEWLRGWLFTGFPWNPLASIWGSLPEMMQVSAYVGALGLGFFTAVVFVAPVIMIAEARPALQTNPWRAAVYVSLLLPVIWGAGAWRMGDNEIAMHDNIRLRLVQPNIPQALKWKSELRQQHVIKQMAMSKRTPGAGGAPSHVIWAETNVPYLIEPGSSLPASLAAAIPMGGALIFGAPRRDAQGSVYNSMLAVDSNGEVKETFDKFHLVPFGEYVPFRNFLPFEKLTAGRGDFTPGGGPKTLSIKGLPPFAAIICYEVIFSGQIVDAKSRPAWILNITNDAWFGPSTGPRQHLVQAQFRAIEEGLPVVRVANTGISAVIDPFGRLLQKLELDQAGIIDQQLPKPMDATIFSKLGQSTGILIAVVGILLAVGLARITGRQPRY